MNLSELAQYIGDEEKEEEALLELGYSNALPYVHSVKRIELDEYGELNTNTVVVIKSGAFVEGVSLQD